jgi:hypothetical protein
MVAILVPRFGLDCHMSQNETYTMPNASNDQQSGDRNEKKYPVGLRHIARLTQHIS